MIPKSVRAQCARNDEALAAINAVVGRLEAKKLAGEADLLRTIAERLAAGDGALLRYSLTMLIID